jgi:hypothetical protein
MASSDTVIVNMRARTTSQLDWWHARLTSLASAVTLPVVSRPLCFDFLGCKIIEM